MFENHVRWYQKSQVEWRGRCSILRKHITAMWEETFYTLRGLSTVVPLEFKKKQKNNGPHAGTFPYSNHTFLTIFKRRAHWSVPRRIQQTHLTSDNCPK